LFIIVGGMQPKGGAQRLVDVLYAGGGRFPLRTDGTVKPGAPISVISLAVKLGKQLA
jgi:hypothetical protein